MSATRDQQVADIRAALATLVEPGQVAELRALNCGRDGTVAGYFDDLDALAREAAQLDNRTPRPTGIYIIMDAIPRALLARAANRVKKIGRTDPLTGDADITRRRWFKIDADANRAPGISATDAEHAAALERAGSIGGWLASAGWPDPVAGDSGNGAHLLYRVDLPNDDASTDLARRCLLALQAKFGDERVKVDCSVYNAARIWKLYGTTARKGDDTDERPHRRARLLSAPEHPQLVTVDQLRALADLAPAVNKPNANGKTAAKPTAKRAADFWKAETPEAVEDWARAAGLTIGTRRSWDGAGYKWAVDCLTSTEHTDGAALLLNGDGYLQYKCQHDSCSGRGAADVFRLYPPPAVVAHRNGTNGAGYSHGHADEQPDGEDLDTDAPQHRGPRLPYIETSAQLSTMLDQTLAAIMAANERTPRYPVLLVRGGALVRLRTNEDGRTVAEIVSSGALLGILARVAIWGKTKVVFGKEQEEEATPPSSVVTALLNAGEWPGLPVLDGIVYAPTFDRRGRLHSAAGYDPQTRLYNAGAVQLGDTTPTAANVRAALALVFGDLLTDFPFVDDASSAHALALYLLPYVRRMIDGPTPLHMASAPAAGTGKSLMVSMALYPALGELPAVDTYPTDPSEIKKLLTAKVIEGAPYLFLDNISGKVDHPALASALTQTQYTDRLLSTHTTVSGKVDWVWAGTANNPTISEELTRRSVLMRLDAYMEQPDRRTGFKHADIAQWAKEHRNELVTAAVTLVRNWQENAAGRRWRERVKGSFEQWAEMMGGILDAAGVAGFLANDDQLREAAAPETADLRTFVAAWAARFGQSPVTVKLLMRIASTVESTGLDANDKPIIVKDGDDLLGALLGNGNERSRETRLGLLLGEHKDRVFGQWRIVEGERVSRSGSRQWCVLPATPPAPRGETTPAADDSAEPCRTLQNLGEENPQRLCALSTSGKIGFREETQNVAEPFGQSPHAGEKTPATDAHTGARTHVCEGTGQKVLQGSAELRETLESPLVDSTHNVAGQEGPNVLQRSANGGNVLQNGLDAYLDRDLTTPELEAAVRAANAAGATFRQLPAGGGLWRLVISAPPDPPAMTVDELIAAEGI